MNTTNLIIGIALIICGGVIGYNLKKCDPIISEIKTTDTVFVTKQIHDTPKVSYPKMVESKPNKLKELPKNIPTLVYIHDTVKDTYTPYNPNYEQADTLSHDGIKVAILDKGNCNGIYSRSSLFFGTQNEKVITQTIEKVVQKQPQLFSLYAGANMSFINTKIDTNYRFKAIDFGPALGLNFKNKAQATYQYGIKTNQHNFSVQIKIK